MEVSVKSKLATMGDVGPHLKSIVDSLNDAPVGVLGLFRTLRLMRDVQVMLIQVTGDFLEAFSHSASGMETLSMADLVTKQRLDGLWKEIYQSEERRRAMESRLSAIEEVVKKMLEERDDGKPEQA